MKVLRRIAACVAMVAMLAVASPARADIIEFNFTLGGDQEVPANDSDAVGAAQLLYDTVTQTFDLDLIVFGIDLADLLDVGPNGTPVHIHLAPPGVNGGIVVDLGFHGSFVQDNLGIRLILNDILLGGPQGGLDTDVNTNEAALFDGNLYVNVHTEDFPGGEIRGQIIPAPGALALLGLAAVTGRTRRRRG